MHPTAPSSRCHCAQRSTPPTCSRDAQRAGHSAAAHRPRAVWAGEVEVCGADHTAGAQLVGASQQAPAATAAAVGQRGGAGAGQDLLLLLLLLLLPRGVPMLALAPAAAVGVHKLVDLRPAMPAR